MQALIMMILVIASSRPSRQLARVFKFDGNHARLALGASAKFFEVGLDPGPGRPDHPDNATGTCRRVTVGRAICLLHSCLLHRCLQC
jgi:hypothetical protein